jgi:hypothetical protein
MTLWHSYCVIVPSFLSCSCFIFHMVFCNGMTIQFHYFLCHVLVISFVAMLQHKLSDIPLNSNNFSNEYLTNLYLIFCDILFLLILYVISYFTWCFVMDNEVPLLLCHVLVTSFVQFCNMNCVTFHWVCNKFSNENQQQFIFNDCESLLLFILYVLCYNCQHSSLEGLAWDVLATCKTFWIGYPW